MSIFIATRRTQGGMGMDLPLITANGHIDRAETTNFFIIKIIFAIKNLLLYYCIETILQQQLH